MTRGRTAIAISLLVLAAVLATNPHPVVAAARVLLGFVSHCRLAPSWKRSLLMLGPILVFAGVLVLLQWIGGAVDWKLPLRTVGVFLLVASSVRLLPWIEFLERAGPGSPLFTMVLFLFILRHFVGILGAESRRLFLARRMMVPNEYGPGWFASLKWALVGLFRGSLMRAERFYVSQALRGIGE